MDRIIGGYPEGSFVLLEIADKSISWSYRPILYHTIADFLLNDHGVMYMPEDGAYSSSVKKLLMDYVSEEVLDKNLRMPTTSERESEDPCLTYVGGESLKEYLTAYHKDYKELRKPVLQVLGLTRLNGYPEDDIRGHLSELISGVRTTKDVFVGVLKPSMKLKDEICEMGDVHLRVIPINGTLNIYGIKPHTALYNISPLPSHEGAGEKKEEDHQLKFTPFV
ncbi:hypothetical protein ES705_44980 [subsurface metagenome]